MANDVTLNAEMQKLAHCRLILQMQKYLEM